MVDTSEFATLITFAMKLKASMKKKNVRRGIATCPKCGGKVTAILAGSRDHIHMACETKNCMAMME